MSAQLFSSGTGPHPGPLPRPVSPLTVKTNLGRTVDIVGYTTVDGGGNGTYVVVLDTNGNKHLVGFGAEDTLLRIDGTFDAAGGEAQDIESQIPAGFYDVTAPLNNWNILFWLRDNANISFANTPLVNRNNDEIFVPVYSCVDNFLYIDDTEHTLLAHNVYNDANIGDVNGWLNCSGQIVEDSGEYLDDIIEIVELSQLTDIEGELKDAFSTLVLMLNGRFTYAVNELTEVSTTQLEALTPNDGDQLYFRVSDPSGRYNDMVLEWYRDDDGWLIRVPVVHEDEVEVNDQDNAFNANIYGEKYLISIAFEDLFERANKVAQLLNADIEDHTARQVHFDQLDVQYSVSLPVLPPLTRADINDLELGRNALYVRTNLLTESNLGAIIKITRNQGGFLATTCMRETSFEGQQPAVFASDVLGEVSFFAASVADCEEVSNTFAEAYGIQQQDTAYVTIESINVTRQAVIIVPPSPTPPSPTPQPPYTAEDLVGLQVPWVNNQQLMDRISSLGEG